MRISHCQCEKILQRKGSKLVSSFELTKEEKICRYTSKSLPCVCTLHHLAMGSGTTSQSPLSCSKRRTNVDLPAAANNNNNNKRWRCLNDDERLQQGNAPHWLNLERVAGHSTTSGAITRQLNWVQLARKDFHSNSAPLVYNTQQATPSCCDFPYARTTSASYASFAFRGICPRSLQFGGGNTYRCFPLSISV